MRIAIAYRHCDACLRAPKIKKNMIKTKEMTNLNFCNIFISTSGNVKHNRLFLRTNKTKNVQ